MSNPTVSRDVSSFFDNMSIRVLLSIFCFAFSDSATKVMKNFMQNLIKGVKLPNFAKNIAADVIFQTVITSNVTYQINKPK